MWIVGSLGLGHTRERWKEEGKARTRERHRGTADDHSEGDALAMDTRDTRDTRDLTKLYGLLEKTSVFEDMLFCETFQARTALLGKLNNAIEVFQTDLGFLLVLLSIIESRGARGCAVGEGRHEPAADKPTVRARVAVNRQLILLLERVQIVKCKCTREHTPSIVPNTFLPFFNFLFFDV